MEMAQMETMAIDEQPASAAPRITAAAAPHKRQVVAAAVGVTVVVGGKAPASSDGVRVEKHDFS
eukprot:3800629-Prymnesium_polylepis.1